MKAYRKDYRSIYLLKTTHQRRGLGPVVLKADKGVHYPLQWIVQLLVSLILIHSIMIYPVDSAIQRLNNRSLEVQRFMKPRLKLNFV